MSKADKTRMKTACFTGHRQIGEPISEVERRLKEAITNLIQKGYLYFGAGGARGFDTLEVVVIAAGYTSGVYYCRNRHLVDNSSVCVAYMTRVNSGTGYTVNYAKAKKFGVMNIAQF